MRDHHGDFARTNAVDGTGVDGPLHNEGTFVAMKPGKEEHLPGLNIKAVSRATGLSPDNLRVRERRYGLPQPQRTPGGHRLYTQRDVAILKWLVAHERAGMSISRAVELWQSLDDQEQEALLAHLVDGADPAGVGASTDELAEEWVQRCLAFDEEGAEETIARAFAIHPVETVCTDVLRAGLARVGEDWYQAKVSVQQEHFASELALRRLERLMAVAPSIKRKGRILLCCPPGEMHTFPLLLLTLMMRMRAWDAVFLGANVPLADLSTTISRAHCELVVLTAQQLHTASALRQQALVLHQPPIQVAFGGRAFNVFPSLCPKIPGHFLGKSLSDAPSQVEQLMERHAAPDHIAELSDEHGVARDHFVAQQPAIESTVWQSLSVRHVPTQVIAIALASLGRNIAAALTFGDLSLLDTELSWLRGYLTNRGIPIETLNRFLTAYLSAATQHLDERGRPIFAWLASVAGETA